MAFKKGIPARELRPYSIEDPYGLGIESPSQRKLHERFHRKIDHKRVAPRNPAARPPVDRAAARERRAAPAAAAAAAAPVAAKKSSNWGCLITLIILGVFWAIGQIFVPLIFGAIRQELVLFTGTSAHGQILKAEATDIELNESTVYELTVLVHIPGQPAYQVELKQALEPAQVKEAREGAWSTLRYDQEDPNNIVLERLGVDPPDPQALTLPSNSDTTKTDDPFLKFDVRGTASVSTRSPHQDDLEQNDAPPADQKTSGGMKAAPGASQPSGAPPSGSKNGTAAKEAAAAGASAPGAKAPEPAPVPASDAAAKAPSPPPPAATPAPPPILPACRRAAACCTLAGGASCGQFVAPGKEKRECTRAFNSFNKQATAAGKTCQ